MTGRAPARPCRLRVVIAATDETGITVCQWADGEYAVRLDETQELVDVNPSQLVFIGPQQATAAA